MLKAYKVYVARQKLTGLDYIVDHSAYFYLMDEAGRFVDVLREELSDDELVARLRKEMGLSSG